MLIGMCEINFTVGKISIEEVAFFFPLTYNTYMPESNLFSRIDEGGIREKNDLKWKDLM